MPADSRVAYLESNYRYHVRIKTGEDVVKDLGQMTEWLNSTNGDWRACSTFDGTLDMMIYMDNKGKATMFQLFWSKAVVSVEDSHNVND